MIDNEIFLNQFFKDQKKYFDLNIQAKKLILKLLTTIQSPLFNSSITEWDDFVKYSSLSFSLFGARLTTVADCCFSNTVLSEGYLSTYYYNVDENPTLSKRTLIHSAKFDLIGNIQGQYNINDFAIPYLIEVIKLFKNFTEENKVTLRIHSKN